MTFFGRVSGSTTLGKVAPPRKCRRIDELTPKVRKAIAWPSSCTSTLTSRMSPHITMYMGFCMACVNPMRTAVSQKPIVISMSKPRRRTFIVGPL